MATYHNEGILLSQLAVGSEEAFSHIYEIHWEELFLTAARVLRNANNAADVVQDVFLSLWNRRAELQIQGSLSAYLHTSVRYKAIHTIEKNINQADYVAMLNETAVHLQGENLSDQLQLKQLQQIVQNVVSGMPPKMQRVYRLSREGHFSHKEIATQLDISPETVKKHIQHALEIIKIAISDHIMALPLALLLGI